eukprot:GCRY01006347.1.p1 GENE.GCRY01006347.1~~GCRY01006347.1.p1  ORF type:complete len:716 (-),score=138.44 GCRY01006347.1:76-2223(-)
MHEQNIVLDATCKDFALILCWKMNLRFLLVILVLASIDRVYPHSPQLGSALVFDLSVEVDRTLGNVYQSQAVALEDVLEVIRTAIHYWHTLAFEPTIHLHLNNVYFQTQDLWGTPILSNGSFQANDTTGGLFALYSAYVASTKPAQTLEGGAWVLFTGLPLAEPNQHGFALRGICNAAKPSVAVLDANPTRRPIWRRALALVHLIGHIFGLLHDGKYNDCNAKGFLMAENETDWSTGVTTCAVQTFSLFAKTNNITCLKKSFPLTNTLIPACGNGIVEEDEQCDCGPLGCVAAEDPCCNASTCVLNRGAMCSALDPCCRVGNESEKEQCVFREKGELCRPTKAAECDTAETCTGLAAACPPDWFQNQGEACISAWGKDGKCYDGECVSLDTTCWLYGGLSNCDLIAANCSVSTIHCTTVAYPSECTVLNSEWGIVDGAPCNELPQGLCYEGECVSPNDVKKYYRVLTEDAQCSAACGWGEYPNITDTICVDETGKKVAEKFCYEIMQEPLPCFVAECESCPTDCLNCHRTADTNITYCDYCAFEYYPSTDKLSCLPFRQNCEIGTTEVYSGIGDERTCVPCHYLCTQCENGDPAWCTSCVDTALWVENTCVACEYPCLTCEGLASNCSTCRPSHYLFSGVCVRATYAWVAGEWSPCVYAATDQSNCTLTGQQTRTGECYETGLQIMVEESQCDSFAAEAKPPLTSSANCPVISKN